MLKIGERGKAYATYLGLLAIVFLHHGLSLSVFQYVVPPFLVAVPLLVLGKISFRFTVRDALIGIVCSVVILFPFWVVVSGTGREFSLPTLQAVLFQLFLAALPEEIYFRGFLQETLGNTVKGVFLVSVLFSLAHLPQFLFHGDRLALFIFLPSLVMGYLYLRTSNVLTPAIFHFLANVMFISLF